MHLT